MSENEGKQLGKKELQTYVPVVSGGVCLSLGLVTDEDIDVRKDLVNLGLEELRNERSRKVHSEGLSIGAKHDPSQYALDYENCFVESCRLTLFCSAAFLARVRALSSP